MALEQHITLHFDLISVNYCTIIVHYCIKWFEFRHPVRLSFSFSSSPLFFFADEEEFLFVG